MRHAGYALDTHIRIHWIDSENLSEQNIGEQLCGLDGIIVPGGFGNRGIEGMILSAKYARETGLPYFGICLGMQIAVMEYARNVCGIADANSGEFDELCKNKVIAFMPGQSNDIDKGGTLRLGSYPCDIKSGTTMERCYKSAHINERHRHRYEFNNDYREVLENAGLTLSGLSPDGTLWKRSSLPTVPSMWAFSSTPNSSPVPTVLIPFSTDLSRRRSPTRKNKLKGRENLCFFLLFFAKGLSQSREMWYYRVKKKICLNGSNE